MARLSKHAILACYFENAVPSYIAQSCGFHQFFGRMIRVMKRGILNARAKMTIGDQT
jgi:hypothetical protein